MSNNKFDNVAFEELVEEYRNDLYIEAYKEAIVKQSIDTMVTGFDEAKYYTANKENFKLNEELLKLKLKPEANAEQITSLTEEIENLQNSMPNGLKLYEVKQVQDFRQVLNGFRLSQADSQAAR